VDLHALINSNRLKIAEILTSKNIKLKTDLQADRHQVYTDKNLADIVIYNLLKYAVNFSKNNDTLHVNTRIENQFIIIEILNKKSGISMANMESHFKNINDYKLKDVQQAEGLGLSIAKNHIELLGGYLRYSSSVSLGFEFLAEFNLDQETNL
jgi:K+-sensing histidine kinase KdpD